MWLPLVLTFTSLYWSKGEKTKPSRVELKEQWRQKTKI